MSNEIIKVIDALCDKLGVAIDWSAENVLPQVQYLVEQYAGYLFVSKTIYSVLSFIIFVSSIATLIVTQKAIIQKKKWAWFEHNRSEGYFTNLSGTTDLAEGITDVSVVCACASLCIFVISFNSLLKAITIPEIYAVQKLLEMIQNM